MDKQELLKTNFEKIIFLLRTSSFDDAKVLLDESLALAKADSLREIEARFLSLKGQIFSDQGDLTDALQSYKQAERIYIDLGMGPAQIHTLRHIGSLYNEIKEFECAEKCLIQVVRYYEGNKTPRMERANSYRVYALALEGLGNTNQSLEYWGKAKKIYQEYEVTAGVEECDAHLAMST